MLVSGTFELPKESEKGYRCGKLSVKGAILPGLNVVLFSEQSSQEGVPRPRALSRWPHSAVGILVGSCASAASATNQWSCGDSFNPSGGRRVQRRERDDLIASSHTSFLNETRRMRHTFIRLIGYVDAIRYLSTVMSDERSRHLSWFIVSKQQYFFHNIQDIAKEPKPKQDRSFLSATWCTENILDWTIREAKPRLLYNACSTAAEAYYEWCVVATLNSNEISIGRKYIDFWKHQLPLEWWARPLYLDRNCLQIGVRLLILRIGSQKRTRQLQKHTFFSFQGSMSWNLNSRDVIAA